MPNPKPKPSTNPQPQIPNPKSKIQNPNPKSQIPNPDARDARETSPGDFDETRRNSRFFTAVSKAQEIETDRYAFHKTQIPKAWD